VDRPELADGVEPVALGMARPKARANSYAPIIPSVSVKACAVDARQRGIPAELPQAPAEWSDGRREGYHESLPTERETLPM
jgi:hypothetical protein